MSQKARLCGAIWTAWRWSRCRAPPADGTHARAITLTANPSPSLDAQPMRFP